MLYQYRCPEGHVSETMRPIAHRDNDFICECGRKARRIFSLFNFTFGFTLSDESRWKEGAPDKFVRNV